MGQTNSQTCLTAPNSPLIQMWIKPQRCLWILLLAPIRISSSKKVYYIKMTEALGHFRFPHVFKPLVDRKLCLDKVLPSKDLFLIILHLRTGYCKLNEYRCTLNQCESFECYCVALEIVQHFILECPLYEDKRQQLLKNIFSQLGINCLDLSYDVTDIQWITSCHK